MDVEAGIAGYEDVLVTSARRVVAGDPAGSTAEDHRARLDDLVNALRHGVAAARG